MQFEQDIKSGSQFVFPEVQDFEPEYKQEIISTCFIDTSVAATYSRQNFIKKMLTLPRVVGFALDGLTKISNFANDLQGSVKSVESRISVLEDSQGDFRLLNERLFKVEMNTSRISELGNQVDDLTKKNQVLIFAVIGLGVLNLGLIAYLLV